MLKRPQSHRCNRRRREWCLHDSRSTCWPWNNRIWRKCGQSSSGFCIYKIQVPPKSISCSWTLVLHSVSIPCSIFFLQTDRMFSFPWLLWILFQLFGKHNVFHIFPISIQHHLHFRSRCCLLSLREAIFWQNFAKMAWVVSNEPRKGSSPQEIVFTLDYDGHLACSSRIFWMCTICRE